MAGCFYNTQKIYCFLQKYRLPLIGGPALIGYARSTEALISRSAQMSESAVPELKVVPADTYIIEE
jgi:hypothetical protein